MTRTPATTHTGFLVEVGRGVEHDAGKVLGEQTRAAGQLGHGPSGCQIMAQIDDPGVAHGAVSLN